MQTVRQVEAEAAVGLGLTYKQAAQLLGCTKQNIHILLNHKNKKPAAGISSRSWYPAAVRERMAGVSLAELSRFYGVSNTALGRQFKADGIVAMRACKECDTRFQTARTGRSKFCSDACAKKGANKRQTARYKLIRSSR